MSQPFLYFVEQEGGAFELEANKLGHIADANEWGLAHVRTGPSNAGGYVVARNNAESIGYYPDQQTWQKSEIGPYWVGYWNDAKPTPEVLIRDQIIPGGDVRLADGQAWHIPVAVEFIDTDEVGAIPIRSRLPALAQYRNGAWFAGNVQEKYAYLWQAATEALDKIMEGVDSEDGEITSDLMTTACAALSGNYHLHVDEVSMLGLFQTTGEEMLHVLNVFTDFRSYVDLVQKKAYNLALAPVLRMASRAKRKLPPNRRRLLDFALA